MKKITSAIAVLILIFGSLSCLGTVRNLSPAEREFLELTSLIITRQERKAFQALPPDQREAFIEDFWARRDPDPDNPENQYQDEYLRRVAAANQLFSGEGGPGFRTDRGRIYVLLGPPDRRDVFPTGYTFYGPPVEAWHYGFFPVIFIDQYKLGSYRLDPGSAYALSQLNLTQMQLKADLSPLQVEENKLSVSLQVEQEKKGLALFKLIIPATAITFRTDASGLNNETVLRVSLEIWKHDGSEKLGGREQDFPLSIKSSEIDKLPRYLVLSLEQKTGSGRYLARVHLENLTDGARAYTEKDFRL